MVTRKRKTTRRVRRRMAVPRIPRGPSIVGLQVARTFYAGSFTPSTTTTANFVSFITPSLNSAGTICGVTMNGLTNVAEYTSLFDQFKLNAIRLQFRTRITDLNYQQSTPAGTFTDVPQMSVIREFRDPPLLNPGTYGVASFNNFCESGKVKTYRNDDRVVSLYFRPKISEQYGSGAVRYISPRWTDLDTNGQAMTHRGVWVYFNNRNFGSAGFAVYDVHATYYLQFKGMR